MDAKTTFQKRFRDWLGPDPKSTIERLSNETGYSEKYLLWAAGLIGKKPWPGSRRFMRRMEKLGCTDKPWRDRSPEAIRRALASREEL